MARRRVEASVLDAPLDPRVVVAAVREIETRGDDPERQLLLIQTRASAPLPAVLVHLLCSPRADELADEVRPWVQQFLASPEGQLCERAWSDVVALRPCSTDDAAALVATPVQLIRLFFLTRPDRVVNLFSPEILSIPGISAAGVEAWRRRLGRTVDIGGYDFTSERSRALVVETEPLMDFQIDAVRDGRLQFADLMTGAESEPFDAVFPFGRGLFSMGDESLSIVMSAGGGNRLALVLLPALGLTVDVSVSEATSMMPHLNATRLTNAWAEYLRRAARLRDAHAAALQRRSDTTERRRVVVLAHTVENPMHHVWNCFTGLERLSDAGVAGEVDEVRTGGSEFYGPLDQMFPELAAAEFTHEPRRAIRDPYPFSSEHVVVAVGGYYIRRHTVARLSRHLEHLPSSGSPAPADLPSRSPVLWIGLRVGSRSWVDQAHALPRLVDAVLERWPDAQVLLDGFSRPVGVDLVSTKWAGASDALRDLADAVRRRTSDPSRVLTMVGDSLRENLLWARATDVYLAPVGSSQHKVGWFTEGPGVMYGSAALADRPADERPGAFESEGRPLPHLLVGKPVSPGERRYDTDVRANLDVDVEEAAIAVMLQLIEQRQAETP